LKAENAILKQNITNELQRTADSYRNDLEIVKARVLSLESSMRKAVNTSNVAGSAQVHLNDLEREAESYRAIYQMSLSKLQESTQQQSFPVKDFRVITAAMPNAMKSWPKSLLTLSLASIAGLALGVLIALMRAWTDKTLHAPLDVRQQIDEHCLAAIPQLAAKQLRIAGLMNASQLAVAGPLRDIRLALNGTFASDTGVVVGVISTNRQEGRSTVALGLASSYVSAGFKTLVVDADFDNPRISQNFAVADERGFMGALTISDHTTMNALVDEKSGLHVMFAGSPSSEAQRLSALSGNAASKTMDQLRRNYDIIIMDFAPLKESNDALAFSALVDSYIYVIEARATRSSDILLALEDAQPVYSRVKGFVLTKTKKHGFVWPFSKLFASSLPKKLSAIETYIPR
jgi:succinoglycan biosynthesis transport protein ExoP